MDNFNFSTDLPLLVFASIFFIIFAISIWGGIILLKAKGDEERIKKGRRILSNSLYGFLTILIIALVFLSVIYFLQKGETPQSSEVSKEFPVSLAVNFPPPPQFISVGGYYFSGPWLLDKSEIIRKSAIYTILCKKNGEYDIIYIGQMMEGEQLLTYEQHKCCLENCEQVSKNLYFAILWTPSDKYRPEERKEIEKNLRSKINPVCSAVESN